MLVIHDVNSFICQIVHVSICVKWQSTMKMVKKWFYMKYDPYFCVLSSLSILICVICQPNVTSDLNWTNSKIFVFVFFSLFCHWFFVVVEAASFVIFINFHLAKPLLHRTEPVKMCSYVNVMNIALLRLYETIHYVNNSFKRCSWHFIDAV